MSDLDVIGPTVERARKSAIERPEVSRSVKRAHHRVKTIFELLYSRDTIDHAQLQAAEKFERHYQGSLGSDVRMGLGERRTADEVAVIESPRTYHAQQVARARRELLAHEFNALSGLVEGGDLCTIGPYKSQAQATAYAVAVIRGSLERLSYLWGFKTVALGPRREAS